MKNPLVPWIEWAICHSGNFSHHYLPKGSHLDPRNAYIQK